MSTQDPDDFLSDYAVLRAPVGCDIDELKRCYRRSMRELHPDLNPQLANEPKAQAALRDLTRAYRHLSGFHREHKRLPGSPVAAGPRSTGANPWIHRPAAPASPGRAVRPRRRAWMYLIGLAVVTTVGIALTGPPSEQADMDGPAEQAISAEPAQAATPRRTRFARNSLLFDTDRGIRLGDTKVAVRAILGPPVIGNDEVWEYGPSHVTFKNGVVNGWFNSPLKPIRVDDE